jgi:hypothetical protein
MGPMAIALDALKARPDLLDPPLQTLVAETLGTDPNHRPSLPVAATLSIGHRVQGWKVTCRNTSDVRGSTVAET